MIGLLLLAIPVIALLRSGSTPMERNTEYYQGLYRLGYEEPEKWTPGQRQFDLGQVVMTPGVQNLASAPGGIERLRDIVVRHSEGHWGDMGEEDSASNDSAVTEGSRIMGSHQLGEEKIWVITEGDRSVTTALLPNEY